MMGVPFKPFKIEHLQRHRPIILIHHTEGRLKLER